MKTLGNSSGKSPPRKRGGRRLLLKRFLRNPGRVAHIVPSSPLLVREVVSRMDLGKPVTLAEFGPGEGCQTREILKRAHPDSRLYLFELDSGFAEFLVRQFADDPRVKVLNRNCLDLRQVMAEEGIETLDYVLSGIPFSFMEPDQKREFLLEIHDSLRPGGSFIIYQLTNELKRFGAEHFAITDSRWFMLNLPPLFITVYEKQSGNGRH